MLLARITALVLLLPMAACKHALPTSAPQFAYAHPIFQENFTCMEHWAGNLQELGDALGSDCVIQQVEEVDGRKWSRAYRGSGNSNEDWYGWRKEVLSPCECAVVAAREHPVTNEPGILGRPPAAVVELLQSDGTHFVLAHVAEIRVKIGESVSAGQVVARVGNNGYSRNPHVHIGAWRDNQPLQVRFDLTAMGKLRE